MKRLWYKFVRGMSMVDGETTTTSNINIASICHETRKQHEVFPYTQEKEMSQMFSKAIVMKSCLTTGIPSLVRMTANAGVLLHFNLFGK